LGTTKQLKTLIIANEVEDVIIAMPSVDGKTIKNIVDSCKNANVTFKILPSIGDLIDGTLTVSQIKNVEIEDLLGREPVVLDRKLIGGYLTGKRVLVTGAAGSIGSEICRQVAIFGPAKLILLEQAETPLYEIEKELIAHFPDVRILPLVADVRDRDKIMLAFEEFTPEVVFHAAAYKHVPMMEYNPSQAVLNNVFGSRNIADAAHQFKAHNLVMISTDKAVNPTNVMGATKRAAEIYIQALSRISKTKFTTVRFGNVLGSNGSVIPLFKEQIAKGGPVTVTDKRIIRYFMTIPEATQLVLQAGSMGSGSEILVLDMGDPVRIIDLAEELIRLSGLTPYEDIDIVVTGLRPGEKLFEELLIDGEGILPTAHKKIKVLASVHIAIQPVKDELDRLYDAARSNAVHELMESLKRLVPEFKPTYSFIGEAPLIFQRVRPDLFPLPHSGAAKIVPLRK
jgi:FlaA1/EpsC-like NDP-sugar epimerase